MVAMEAVPALPPPGEGLLAAARALLSRGNALAYADAVGVLTLQAGRGQRHAAGLPCLRLDHAYGSCWLALEQERGESPLGDARWQDYDGEARLLAWSLSHESMVAALGALLGQDALPAAFLPIGGERDKLWLRLLWQEHDGGTVSGWVGLAEADLRALAARTEWRQDPSSPALIGDAVSLSVRLVVPGHTLDAATAAALAPGDVLVVGHEADCEARLQPDDESARHVFGLPEGWPVQRRQGEWQISQRPLLTAGNEATRPLFLLTRLSMSLDDLGALRPGSALQVDGALIGATVGIMFGGRRYGEGTVVRLGDWLGVRIAQRD
ncbi:FliM/FliN family flagellar motor switch protein [Dyella sp. 2RAB6]|uniref:FliM/FliN family flagellar motor switch protein n=1 Tax=Dyella sp. 2RAB6 TaxID=3232992 RepID=UPI003F8E9D38